MIDFEIVKFRKAPRLGWFLTVENTGSEPIYGASIDVKVKYADGTTSSELLSVDDIDPGEKTRSHLTLLRPAASIKLFRLTMVKHDYSDTRENQLDLTYRKKLVGWEKVD
ncbi:hypothetical protein [Henriciella sp.]|uniref:hypothetical protein n=1 Tax=Henriciella sp. TaxID=1968823 RepID=UPI00261CE933|nr:hypothetical protein [Henriciella sp.]